MSHESCGCPERCLCRTIPGATCAWHALWQATGNNSTPSRQSALESAQRHIEAVRRMQAALEKSAPASEN